MSQELLKIAEIVTLRSDRSRTGSVGRATVGLNNFRVSHGGVQGKRVQGIIIRGLQVPNNLDFKPILSRD